MTTRHSVAAVPIGPDTIRRYVLSNGMRLVVQENHASPSVVLHGHVWAGAIFEPAEQTGLASFTASAITHGTTTRTFQQINATTEAVGAAIEIDGGRHLVHLGGKALAEDFELIVDVLADVLRNPTFPPAEVSKVGGQILTRLKEIEDDTQALANREFRRLLYTPDHPYGRPVSGMLETIARIQRDDLVNFYQAYYHPEQGILVVVGDVSADAVYEALERHLGDWRPDSTAPAWQLPPVPRLNEPRRAVRTMANKTQVDIVLGTVGPARRSSDIYAAWLADTILGHLGLMGRLGRNVRDDQGLAYYTYSGLEAGLGPGPWSVRAGVAPEHVERAIASILAEIARLRHEPVSDQELEDSCDYLTGSLPLRLETNEGVADTLLHMELYELGDDYVMRYPQLIRSVTKEQVQQAAQHYLDPEHYALAIVGPYQEP